MDLSETWFIEGHIDFELQKYRLLAYLQGVKDAFSKRKLYPQLANIVQHYNNLVSFRENKRLLHEHFPQRLTGLDLGRMEAVYERSLADDGLMQELEQITQYAAAEMKTTITEGAEIYEMVEKQLQVEPVGIMPFYKNEGYVMLRYGADSDVHIYNYGITLFEHGNARYQGIRMDHMETRTSSITNTYEHIKLDLIRSIRTLPNPAVYKVETPLIVPFHETLLPVAKRVLVRYISGQGN